ncbi:hypothetical protein GDO86_005938 [Hymenochirus boettgeri]|uniref:Armadillo repeat-containing domain-containing protein n=1 Tax=Hymenochirus boettgeri TaxID=247094 RepID=A0A8T2J421_9PIPI|nr:hypothetical protein GDO86_005938 [Hymenochirus boettgeri]
MGLMRGNSPAMRSLLGLTVSIGLGYCVYRVVRAHQRKKQHQGCVGTGSIRGPSASEKVSVSASDLEPHHLEKLIDILATSSDISLQEQVLVTLCNSAAFSRNQDIIRNLGGIAVIGNILSGCSQQAKVHALNALNNLSMNLQNQEIIKDYINQTCNNICSTSLNSEVQLAGLRLVINMSVTDNYHNLVVAHLPIFLFLLEEGNTNTQIYSLKVLVNLSANPDMTTILLTSKAPQSLTSIFNSCINRDILVRALTFVANLSKQLKSDSGCNGLFDYDKNSIYNLLFEDASSLQDNLAALFQYPNVEVKEQVSRILINWPGLRPLNYRI